MVDRLFFQSYFHVSFRYHSKHDIILKSEETTSDFCKRITIFARLKKGELFEKKTEGKQKRIGGDIKLLYYYCFYNIVS